MRTWEEVEMPTCRGPAAMPGRASHRRPARHRFCAIQKPQLFGSAAGVVLPIRRLTGPLDRAEQLGDCNVPALCGVLVDVGGPS